MQKIEFKDLPDTSTPINSENLNLLQTNVESAINGIVESGNNTNGNYIKYTDGTMICHFSKGLATTTCTQVANMYQYEFSNPFTFPVPFVDTPSVTISNGYVSSAASALIWAFQRNNVGIQSIKTLSPSNFSGQYVAFNYIAIGKWK